MEICEKFCVFWTNLLFVIKKIAVIVWQICSFWSKTQNTWDGGWQSKLFRGNWTRSEQKRGVLIALYSVPSNMGVHSGFISYYNLNFIKYLVISIFATLAGGDKCIKEQDACSNKSGNPRHSAKSSKFWFLFESTFKPHLQNSLIDLRQFLTQTAKGKRHIKSKIKSWIWWTHLQIWPLILSYPFFLGHKVCDPLQQKVP